MNNIGHQIIANQEDNRLYPFANSIFIVSEPQLVADSSRTEIVKFLISELEKNDMTPYPTRILTDYLSSITGNLPIGFVLEFLVNDIRNWNENNTFLPRKFFYGIFCTPKYVFALFHSWLGRGYLLVKLADLGLSWTYYRVQLMQ